MCSGMPDSPPSPESRPFLSWPSSTLHPSIDTRPREAGSSSTALQITRLPPNVSIRAPTKANVHLLKRINSLLLPVSYPENFYREILQNPESEALTRLAFYDEECVGGIRCRLETAAEYQAGLEKLDTTDIYGSSKILEAVADHKANGSGGRRNSEDSHPKRKVYIMTLAVLSPYRSLSIGSHLLDYILSIAAKEPTIDADLAYAHVWVSNDGALEFYRKQDPKRRKRQDAREISAQTAESAFRDGQFDPVSFVNSREYEIRSLLRSMNSSKNAQRKRAFQSLPRELRRRTAAHNPNRAPKRVRETARKELTEDNTTVRKKRRDYCPSCPGISTNGYKGAWKNSIIYRIEILQIPQTTAT
ncbi:hypothetical protein TWF788_001758 [Orbilia oligospora]|uniref:N-acetyltransferase domain-containing protein n=1 Tax=Orbilia oligospora TaxID=2813651 RepID=A0A7C8K6B6_ORBOL|nr:hypothetical protein TWF788_001758 [Orbilia oligospora]